MSWTSPNTKSTARCWCNRLFLEAHLKGWARILFLNRLTRAEGRIFENSRRDARQMAVYFLTKRHFQSSGSVTRPTANRRPANDVWPLFIQPETFVEFLKKKFWRHLAVKPFDWSSWNWWNDVTCCCCFLLYFFFVFYIFFIFLDLFLIFKILKFLLKFFFFV